MRALFSAGIIFFTLLGMASGQGPGSAAVPFVQIGLSPALGAGESASAVFPTDDTFGFFYNPAHIGIFARDNNFAIQFYPSKLKWLPQFNFPDLTLNSHSFNMGYVLKDFFDDGIDLNLGAGYIRTVLNLGESVQTDETGAVLGTFQSSENYDAYAIGLGFEYYAYFALGYTYKKINSNLAPAAVSVGNETIDGRADASAYDIGFHVSLPLIKTDDGLSIGEMDFVADSYLGYARTNIGGYIKYAKHLDGDPLPRIAKLGIGFSVALIETYGSYDVKVIDLQVANEANDLLIKSDGRKRSYQSGNGDIRFFDNVLLGNSNDLVQTRNSLRIRFFESASFGFHKMRGPGFPDFVYNTSFMFSLSGIMRVFTPEYYKDLGKYVDLRYARCDIETKSTSPLDDTVYHSLSLYIKNIF